MRRIQLAAYTDKNGVRIAFAIEDGFLIKYVNERKQVGAKGTSGVVTQLRCSFTEKLNSGVTHFDVRDQFETANSRQTQRSVQVGRYVVSVELDRL